MGQRFSDTSFRVTEERAGDTIRLIAESARYLDVTVTVAVTETEGSSAPRNRRVTVDSAGKPRFELLRLQRKDKRRAWSYRYRVYWRPGGRGGRHDDAHAYLLPYSSAARRRVVQGPFGGISHGRGSQNEHAIDWSMPEGTTVRAARGGVVVGVREDRASGGGNPDESAPGGNHILIRHSDGTYAEYLHLQRGSARVKLRQTVAAGEPVARSGNTGRSTGPHLHFAVFRTLDGLRRQTIPVRFRVGAGVVQELREGERY